MLLLRRVTGILYVATEELGRVSMKAFRAELEKVLSSTVWGTITEGNTS